jgi:hypothetical protein
MPEKLFEAMPDFLVIGAGKSGTTSIDKYLNQHPDVFVPRKKEPNFFGYENVNIENLRENPDDTAHFQTSVTTLEEYLKIFEDAKPHQKKGETSNTYMYHADAPSRIKHYIPNVKLIAILRQPAERLFSRYMHLARENRTPTKDFSDCLDRNSIWWKRNDLIREGFYCKNLSPYFKLFPQENIRIYLYEDLKNAPIRVMSEIYEFIGVDPSFKPDVSLKYNESGLIKNKLLDKIYGQGGWLSRSVKTVLPGIYRKMKGNLSLKKKMLSLRGRNLDRREMDKAIRKALTLEVYLEDIKQLQNLIHRDLSDWLKV